MANLNDLNYSSISQMNNDEALELLRQIRLSRRESKQRQTVKVKKPTMSPEMAADILRLLQGNSDEV